MVPLPPDGANINKSINVCACESLADYNLANGNNNDGSCIKRTPSDSDTLDLSTCPPEVTAGCTDGIQDLYHVGCWQSQEWFVFPLSAKVRPQLSPTPTSTSQRASCSTSPASTQIQRSIDFTSMWNHAQEWLWSFTAGFRWLTERLSCNIYFQLNVPLINAETLKWHESSFNKFEDTIPFLENVPDIPNFPVVWIDLGADVESVRRENSIHRLDWRQKFSGPRPRGQTYIGAGDAGSDSRNRTICRHRSWGGSCCCRPLLCCHLLNLVQTKYCLELFWLNLYW